MPWNTGTACAPMTVPHMSRPPCHGKREQQTKMRFVNVIGFGNATEPEKTNYRHKYGSRTENLDAPEECKMTAGSSKPLILGSGRYSKSSGSWSGNKSLKAGISWRAGIPDPRSFRTETAASASGLRSGVTMMCLLPVFSIRWATPGTEFRGEMGKAVPSARTIPSFAVAYVIVSERQSTMRQRGKVEKHGWVFLTRVGQHRNDRLCAADLRFG